MAHATLLSGESGIGKKTLARLLAQGLLCRGEGTRPCGQCRDCKRFLARTHPDALFPVPAPKEKNIKIDALRQVIDALSRHSLEGGNRVILIENAERMTPAQNPGGSGGKYLFSVDGGRRIRHPAHHPLPVPGHPHAALAAGTH